MIHIAACSLLATSTTLILPSPPPRFVNMLLPQKWTCCVFCKFCFLWHKSSIWLFLCTNLSLNFLQADVVQLHLFTAKILCLLAFLILTWWWWETFLWPVILYLSAALSSLQISASSPWMYKVFLWKTIHKSYLLFFFCQFSLLSHFSNLRDHWNRVEKSVLVAFWHAWRSKGWKRLHNPYLREDLLVWGVPSW